MTEKGLRVPALVRQALDALGLRRGECVGVALSGGADSVALLLALREAGMLCTALHCNFGLRGHESDDDEMFVRGLCDSAGVPLELVRFDVPARRAATGESVEMSCRELRYNWFAEKAGELGLRHIAVGHHLEDDVETFFLNLLRGSGLPGLAGMAARRGIYIRPLLRCTRPEIEAYLHDKGAEFVTDSTNLSDCYGRNNLRLNVIPAFEKAVPGAVERIGRSIGYMHDDLALLDGLLAQKRSEYTGPDGSVDISSILNGPSPEHLLFRMLLPLYPGFVAGQAAAIVEAARRGESGRIFDVGAVRMLLDRGKLSVYEEVAPVEPRVVDFRNPSTLPEWLSAVILPRSAFHPGRDATRMWIDAGALSAGYRFMLRSPRTGDRIAPFGMKGTRLLSDIFSDAKLSETAKHRIVVLVAVDSATGDEKILWLPGLRASRHFPVTAATAEVLELHCRK